MYVGATARVHRRRRPRGAVLPARPGVAEDGPAKAGHCVGRDVGSSRASRGGFALMALVEVSHLVKYFERNAGLFRKGTLVKAVDDVSFTIEEGETFGLGGESGSGKTTTGRCMLRLIAPTSGEVRVRGENVLAFSRRRLREARRDM